MSSGELVPGAIIRSKHARTRRRLLEIIGHGEDRRWLVETLGTYPTVYTIHAEVIEQEWVVEHE